ncbi:protoporphyrinogen oxidase [Marinicauda salina]|uniref:Protoporphyrinogen oxidase n=1 Tax=Marinicauda salina TaxID=2135793 RepID=A0A2U2BWW6_9PROT|nr:flavodoxin domain-containing protein [Marinicauda salina]PWE18513.1 protoporphyrinogen oxidase [Marinicauda salina]
MADILIVYATVEGQSRRIADLLGDHLVRCKHGRTLVDATDPPEDLDVSAHDAVILVASVHADRHHAAAVNFARKNVAALNRTPSALVSVSLHAASGEAEDEEEMRAYVDRFCAETGWLPRAVHYAAGALRFAQFDFFKRWMARRLTRELGMEFDPERDVELTDWRALEAFADDFLAEHVGR